MEIKDNNVSLFEDGGHAWMIRNDGKAIPCQVHYYGSQEDDDVEETLYAAEWLYKYTRHEETKKAIIEFIACWIDQIYPDFSEVEHDDYDAVPRDVKLKEEIAERPYKFLSVAFVEAHADELNSASFSKGLTTYNTIIKKELNQEFLRARYGGKYDTAAGNSDMYFRISSTGFDWFGIIYEFVHDHKRLIKTVTICKDEESTGYKDYYYSHKGVVYDHLDTEEFLTQSGNPHVESVENGLEEKLSTGASLLGTCLKENKNPLRVIMQMNMLEKKLIQRDYTRRLNKE